MWFEPDIGTDGRVIMRGHLDHVKGHGKTCAISLPLETSGNKNNVQGIGSSISYGKRYAAIALLNIVSHAPEDHDTDGAVTNEFVSDEQIDKLRELIVESGADIPRFLTYMNVDKIDDIPAKKFGDAVAALQKKKSKPNG